LTVFLLRIFVSSSMKAAAKLHFTV
jgi:hypothetical protein